MFPDRVRLVVVSGSCLSRSCNDSRFLLEQSAVEIVHKQGELGQRLMGEHFELKMTIGRTIIHGTCLLFEVITAVEVRFLNVTVGKSNKG